MKLRCGKCGYTWNYRGESDFYATCPNCYRKVKIDEAKVEVERKTGEATRGIARIVSRVVEAFENKDEMLIQVLLTLQGHLGWLPREVLMEVSEQLGVDLPHVWKIATFYKIFSLEPKGKHAARLCIGTSCKARGASLVLDRVKAHLAVEPGETTPDLEYTFETVNCLGCCAMGPVMDVDGEYQGGLSPSSAVKVLEQVRGE